MISVRGQSDVFLSKADGNKESPPRAAGYFKESVTFAVKSHRKRRYDLKKQNVDIVTFADEVTHPKESVTFGDR